MTPTPRYVEKRERDALKARVERDTAPDWSGVVVGELLDALDHLDAQVQEGVEREAALAHAILAWKRLESLRYMGSDLTDQSQITEKMSELALVNLPAAARELLEKVQRADATNETIRRLADERDSYEEKARKWDAGTLRPCCGKCGERVESLMSERDSYREDAEKWRKLNAEFDDSPEGIIALWEDKYREIASLKERLATAARLLSPWANDHKGREHEDCWSCQVRDFIAQLGDDQ